MSKANQKFVQADDAVSPVIGVILMVAITVVLAAVVFVLVSNLSKTSNKAPDVSFNTDETTDRITVVKAATGLDWTAFQIKANGAYNARIAYNADAVASGTSNQGTSVDNTYDPLASTTTPFTAGDFIDFCRPSASANSGITIQILHTESNTVVYETSFNGILAC